jgi:hypothetical protein
VQLAYAGQSGVEASEISRLAHSLETNAAGIIDYRERVAAVLGTAAASGGGGGGRVGSSLAAAVQRTG